MSTQTDTKASQPEAATTMHLCKSPYLQVCLETIESDGKTLYRIVFTLDHDDLRQFELMIPDPHASGRDVWDWMQNPASYGDHRVISSDGDSCVSIKRTTDMVQIKASSLLRGQRMVITQTFLASDCVDAFQSALSLLDETAWTEEWLAHLKENS